MINTLLKILWIVGVLFAMSILSFASIVDYPVVKEQWKINIIGYTPQIINFWDIKVEYEIGFSNKINGYAHFIPLQLTFSQKIEAILVISTSRDEWKNRGDKRFYKQISINSEKLVQNNDGKFIFSDYFYKDKYGDNFHFDLQINTTKKELSVKNLRQYEESLYIVEKWTKVTDFPSDSKITSLFKLLQFNTVNIQKKEFSQNEIEILEKYVFQWWKLVVSKKNFEKYLQKNKNIQGYNEWCDKHTNCDYYNKNNIELSRIYKYGFWYIFLWIRENWLGLWRNEFRNYELNNLLIDTEIESKFVPFNIILGFIIIYFVVLIFIHFGLWKIFQKNKFYLLKAIPITSIVFLVTIMSISMYYRWFEDIENKLQVNYHLWDRVIEEVHILTFSSQWWDYNIDINTNDFSKQWGGFYRDDYRRNYSHQNISIQDNIITKKILWFNSAWLLKFQYNRVVEENNNQKLSKNSLSSFKKIEDIKKYISENITHTKEGISQTHYYDLGREFFNEISSAYVSQWETEYMKKYSFGWRKNKNIIIDIFYK